MEPVTIAVLAITAAFSGFCIWIERHSRRQERTSQSSESVDDRPDATEESGQNGNGGGPREIKGHAGSPSTSDAPRVR
jgi:hypothetical protein